MKTLMLLSAVCVLSIAQGAFAGTQVSHLSISNAVDFFKGDASNFEITSLSLGRDVVVAKDVIDDACLSTAETPSDCHHESYVKADVVHVNITFDSNASQYQDGGNAITLSLPQKAFNSAELAKIKGHASAAAVKALVKLSIASFKARVSQTDASNCGGDESIAECGDRVQYGTTKVSKIRVSVSR